MKINSIILFLLTALFFGCTEKRSNNMIPDKSQDSLSIYLSLSNDVNLSLQEKQKFNEKAFNIIVKQKDDSVQKINLFKVANRYYNMSDWQAYKQTSNFILQRALKSKDSVNIAKAHSYLGDYFRMEAVPDSAFLNYFAAEKIYTRIKEESSLARTYINRASLQFDHGDLFASEITIFKALTILKDRENVNDLLYDCYNFLGIVYNKREDYTRALEYHNKALTVSEQKDIQPELQLKASSLNNIGYVFLSKQDYTNAKIYFKKALNEKKLFQEYTSLYAMALDNLAYARMKSRDFNSLPEEFFRALTIRDSLGLNSGVMLSKIHLSEYYSLRKDTTNAIKFAKEALVLSRTSNDAENTLDALRQISIVDNKKASIYSKEYIQLNDKMLKAERNMGEKFSRIEYETNEIKDQNSSLQEKNKTLVYVFSICTLLGLFFYVYKTQQAKNRELLFKQQQQIANEDIYNLMISQQNEIELTRRKEKKRVAQELHDGVLGRMFGIRISLDSLDKVDEAEAASKRKKYLTELKNVEQDIREISHDLNREKSELINNFVSMLIKLFEDQRNTYSSKLITAFDPEIKWDLISNIEKINLYRIVQEGLQNCNKYAKADIIKVEFKNENNNLVLTIEDDGIGFNANKTKNGIGLHNIEYRAKECKGTVTINSAKGEGTVLIIKVPIDPNSNLHNNDI